MRASRRPRAIRQPRRRLGAGDGVHADDQRTARDTAGNEVSADIVFTFTAGSTPAPSDDVQPEWNAKLDVIVFASNLLGNYDIFSINANGTELLQHTFSPDDEMQPTLSRRRRPAGLPAAQPGGKWRIYLQSFGSSNARALTSGTFNDEEPAFSHTISDRIAFVSDQRGFKKLYLMNSDGSNPREQDIGFLGSEEEPALHPLLDTQLLFTSGVSGNLDIWRKTVSAVDGSTININLTASDLTHEHSPSWSSDASFVAYLSDQSGSDNLWQADSAGTFPATGDVLHRGPRRSAALTIRRRPARGGLDGK